MAEIIGVRFKSAGKVYYFSPGKQKLSVGEKVIVETARGVECGEVALANKQVDDSRIVKPLKDIIRKATEADLKTVEQNKQKEKDAFRICQEKIAAHKLDMKLVDVECTFDNNKILFYFSADLEYAEENSAVSLSSAIFSLFPSKWQRSRDFRSTRRKFRERADDLCAV